MRHLFFALACAVAATGLVTPAIAFTVPTPVIGTWVNPKGSIAVRTAPCGGNLCGAIVWASGVALQDARAAGVGTLVGVELLQDYRPGGHGIWTGRVYVPDMGRSFSSRIEQPSPDTLKISGCLVGGLFCRSQLWHRIR